MNDQRPHLLRRIARFETQAVTIYLDGVAVPAHVVDEAVQHGWPAELFTKLIGSLPELERSAQPPVENRVNL